MGISHHNDTPRAMSDADKAEIAARHGDRALAFIGDERVSLTDEDVCLLLLPKPVLLMDAFAD